MPTVAIIHHSGSGKTAMLAKAVADGARSVSGTTVSELAIDGKKIVDGRFADDALFAQLDAADAIIFGSPTYMGMVSGQFKCFADATAGRWFKQAWKDKLAAGFTTSGSPSGDKQGTLLYLVTLASQHGMVWVSSDAMNEVYLGKDPAVAMNRLGSTIGVMSQVAPTPEGKPTDGDNATARNLGARVARLAAKR